MHRSIVLSASAALLSAGPFACQPAPVGTSSSPAEPAPSLDLDSRMADADRPDSEVIDLDQYERDLEYLASLRAADRSASPGEPRPMPAPPDPAVEHQRIVWRDTFQRPRSEDDEATDYLPIGIGLDRLPSLDDPGTPPLLPLPFEQDRTSAFNATSDSEERRFPRPADLAEALVPFAAQLHREAARSQSPLREYLVAASLAMLNEQRRLDPSRLPDLTERERDILRRYQDHFIELGRALKSGGGSDTVVAAMRDLAEALGPEQLLRITEFKLCTRIMNFGLYDEVPSMKFIAGRATPLLTYIEIENFTPVLSAEGRYHTRIRHEVELFTEKDGLLVYREPSLPADDYCKKVRRDFFLPRQITLPANLSMGRYLLKVRIIDEHSQHQAEATLSISIVAAGDLAAN